MTRPTGTDRRHSRRFSVVVVVVRAPANEQLTSENMRRVYSDCLKLHEVRHGASGHLSDLNTPFADSGKQTNTQTSSLLTCGVENVSHTQHHIDVPGGVER